jgi:hypothetical protein
MQLLTREHLRQVAHGDIERDSERQAGRKDVTVVRVFSMFAQI